MSRGRLVGGAITMALVVFVLTVGGGVLQQASRRVEASPGAAMAATGPTVAVGHLLYGRVTTDDGMEYEGRLRWGGDEEALWTHYFNGFKPRNRWAVFVPEPLLPKSRSPIEFLGFEVASLERDRALGRPFMARFGDIARVEADGRALTVTLRNGTTVDLDRFAADDFADGLRVWDGGDGWLDLGEWDIRAVEFLPERGPADGVAPLFGIVRTADASFTGLLQWDREAGLVSDELEGYDESGLRSVRFASVRFIEHAASGGSLVTLRDGQEVVLTGTRQVDQRNRGIYVDDPRYGRVLVSWNALERAEFVEEWPRRAHQRFTGGEAIGGQVTTRSGRRFDGRLIFDLDESLNTETLDAPRRGVDYSIPFGQVMAIRVEARRGGGSGVNEVTLTSGEVLYLESAGDLGEGNAGVLVFGLHGGDPEYIPWVDVETLVFHPAAR